MKYLKISNPREITKEELELFGMSNKRTNPNLIGEKGTGLKFSRMQALRLGIDTVVATNEWMNTLLTEKINEENERVIYQYKNKGKKRVQNVKSSYTQSGGVFDWGDPWFIVREFIQNARDEIVSEEIETADKAMELTLKTLEIVDEVNYSPKGVTTCYIAVTKEIEEVFNNIKKYFVFDYRFRGQSGGIVNARKECVYKQGILVDELKTHSAMFACYDCLGLELSESRTIKNSADVFGHAIKILNESPIQIKREFIKYAKENFSNDECNYSWSFNEFKGSDWGQAFVNVFGDKAIVHDKKTTEGYEADKIKTMGLIVIPLHRKLCKVLKEYGIRQLKDVVFSSNSDKVRLVELNQEDEKMLNTAQDICKKVFGETRELETYVAINDELSNTLGFYNKSDNKIYISASISFTMENILTILIEEYTHAISGADDCTREFQNFVCRNFAKTIVKK